MILVAQERESAIDTQYIYYYYVDYSNMYHGVVWKVMASYNLDHKADDGIGCFDSCEKAIIVLGEIAEAIANGDTIYYVPNDGDVKIEGADK